MDFGSFFSIQFNVILCSAHTFFFFVVAISASPFLRLAILNEDEDDLHAIDY